LELHVAANTSLPEEPDELPADMAEAIAALHLLDDEALWRAARTCLAPDPHTGEMVRIFDPRRQVWPDHFGWSTEGDLIMGKTPTGRATIAAVRLNRAELVEARRG
jgi:hypothetical protein